MELLKGSVAMQEQVLACKGFLVIGYSLEKVSTFITVYMNEMVSILPMLT